MVLGVAIPTPCAVCDTQSLGYVAIEAWLSSLQAVVPATLMQVLPHIHIWYSVKANPGP